MRSGIALATLAADLLTVVGTLPALAAPEAGQVVPRFSHILPDVPGKSLIAVEVTLAPDQASAPHHHPKSASIMAYVLLGVISSQLEG